MFLCRFATALSFCSNSAACSCASDLVMSSVEHVTSQLHNSFAQPTRGRERQDDVRTVTRVKEAE